MRGGAGSRKVGSQSNGATGLFTGPSGGKESEKAVRQRRADGDGWGVRETKPDGRGGRKLLIQPAWRENTALLGLEEKGGEQA